MNHLIQCVDCGKWHLEKDPDAPHIRFRRYDSGYTAWVVYDCVGRPLSWAAKHQEEEFAKEITHRRKYKDQL